DRCWDAGGVRGDAARSGRAGARWGVVRADGPGCRHGPTPLGDRGRGRPPDRRVARVSPRRGRVYAPMLRPGVLNIPGRGRLLDILCDPATSRSTRNRASTADVAMIESSVLRIGTPFARRQAHG